MTFVTDFGSAWWSEVLNRIIGAAVFIDDATAECLHWEGGLFHLLSAGAVAVKSLSSFECANKSHKKALFLTQATSSQLRSVRDIITHSEFSHCILISTVSLDVVFLEMNSGKDVSAVIASGKAPVEATRQIEDMLVQWMNTQPCSVEVVHIPIFTISPTNNIFVTPPFAKFYPEFNGKLIPDTASIDLYTISEEERSLIRRLASSLNSMLGSMNLKEDIFFMGTGSSLVASVLENSPVCLSRKKTCSNPATLILIDGTLDLCGVTTHTTDCILDKVMSVLPRFPGHCTDVAVDMSPLCEANVISVTEDLQLSPGCLYHRQDEQCVTTFQDMITKSQKEIMSDLYNKLSKIDVLKSPGPKTLLKVTPQSLDKIVVASKGKYDLIESNIGLLQQALGVVQTLKSAEYSQMELLTSLESQFQQNIATSRESTAVLFQISNLIKSRKARNLSLERLLALLVYIYSLSGPEMSFSKEHEASILETLSVALFEDHGKVLRSSMDEHVMTPEGCEDLATSILNRLKDVGQMRRILQRYKSVLKPSESGATFEYSGVLQQLVDDLVNPDRPELPDLCHRNEGIKDLFRSGFGILSSKKSRTAKHPLDNPLVIIFVLGGISVEQATNIHRRIVTSGVDNATVILGSTRLVNPVEAATSALGL